jgi:hypothetical protein
MFEWTTHRFAVLAASFAGAAACSSPADYRDLFAASPAGNTAPDDHHESMPNPDAAPASDGDARPMHESEEPPIAPAEAGGTETGRDDAAIDDGEAQGPDAAPSDCDEVCRSAGGTGCSEDTCVIDCEADGDCADTVHCPPGLPCRVVCGGEESCPAGVDCTEATRCDIQCRGVSSCAVTVDCAGEACNVDCAARGACPGALRCEADECVIRCGDRQSCGDTVSCSDTTSRCSVDCLGSQSCLGGVCCNADVCNIDGPERFCRN